MPFWRTYYHLIWATKNRADLIRPELEAVLFQYLINKAAEMDVRVYAIDGWTDHLHLVVSIPPKHAISAIVKRLKGSSSHYLNESGLSEDAFAWQRGYGVFTLGENQRARAENYVRNQKEHHRRQVTNDWLERVDAFDEGPPDEGLKPDAIPLRTAVLREETADYEIDGPFP